ncbi:MarR family winged helix-turn-helix transcriptional regulator [Kocuria marina]|uniref:MarR family winged helix-turn-helix transcriptional regulator n=1 Tax=Kocuria marina TaxID=223184 RepID=UPI00068B845B|nr:MarR family transcriptional regulator [Kocuria marina]
MESSATWYGPVSPQSRALRRVVVLNAEIASEIRRILGLKETDYAAMAMLIVHSMGPTELAHALHITTASATAVVDRLVRAGHVVREPVEGDRRRMTVRAVTSSRERTREHVVPVIGMVEDEVDALDEPGREAVLRFLSGTASRLEEYLEDLCGRADQASQDDPGAGGS